MDKTDYKDAIQLSRNFSNRSAEETKVLYNTIQQAVSLAKKKSERESELALEFLLEIYKPFIKKIAGKYFSYIESPMEFDDVIQEVYVIFLMLIYKYDKDISSFSYYIKLMLPQYMNVWLQKINADSFIPVDVNIIEATYSNPSLNSSSKVFNYFDSLILEKEFVNFIEERSEKSSRSKTVKEVCNKIFLGNTTCSELASELNISYHAVYEIINKIKRELIYFFNQSGFSEYFITSTGEYRKTSTGREYNFS